MPLTTSTVIHPEPPTGSTKTLIKALALLHFISEQSAGTSLSRLSEATDLPKPTVHRLLSVLVEHRLVRSEDGIFQPGTECLRLGRAYLDSLDLRLASLALLQELVDSTNETAHLGIRDGNRIVYIEKVEAVRSVRVASRVGLTNPVHSTAIGKAILAYSAEAEVGSILSSRLDRCTPNTIVDPAQLRKDLAETRVRGFAIDRVENEDGISCVAAPVFDHDGEVVAAISVTGPEYRIPQERIEELGREVRKISLAVSRRVGYQEPGTT